MAVDLVQANRPIIYFHRKEKNFLSSIEYYLEDSDLKIDNDFVLYAPTQEQLYNFSKQEDEITRARICRRSKFRRRGQPNNPVCYAYVKEYDTNPDHFYITYVFFYCYNSNFKILHLIPVGGHEADIEHFTIEFNKLTRQITRYYFGAHGFEDGGWYFPNEVEFEDGRPVVYVSKISHGCYVKPGIIPRNYYFANDWTRKDIRFDPRVIYIRDEKEKGFDINQSWIYYRGRMASNGIWSVSSQQWWNEIENHNHRPKFAGRFLKAILSLIS